MPPSTIFSGIAQLRTILYLVSSSPLYTRLTIARSLTVVYSSSSSGVLCSHGLPFSPVSLKYPILSYSLPVSFSVILSVPFEYLNLQIFILHSIYAAKHINRRCSPCMILRYNLECFIAHRRNILNKYSYCMS